jgi:hypothetical protein
LHRSRVGLQKCLLNLPTIFKGEIGYCSFTYMRLQASSSLRRAFLHSVRHARFLATRPALTLGIRREDPSRIWERRVPLTPKAVQSLISEERVRVLLQPCARRVFPTEEYVKVSNKLYRLTLLTHLIKGWCRGHRQSPGGSGHYRHQGDTFE